MSNTKPKLRLLPPPLPSWLQASSTAARTWSSPCADPSAAAWLKRASILVDRVSDEWSLVKSEDEEEGVEPENVPSKEEVAREMITTGASCPWNLSTVPTRADGPRRADRRFTLYSLSACMKGKEERVEVGNKQMIVVESGLKMRRKCFKTKQN